MTTLRDLRRRVEKHGFKSFDKCEESITVLDCCCAEFFRDLDNSDDRHLVYMLIGASDPGEALAWGDTHTTKDVLAVLDAAVEMSQM